ncbi:VCBS domain-containing protein, partial [Aminobacter sp. Piv2-1]|uniref:VCBS domain-containing protein n=1 Tax=Aminobacter sp. Piv2-1 TaxID=3031122 RepID=UPI0030B06048
NTATYTMTLLQPVQHTVSGTEDNTAPFTVNVAVSDTDGPAVNTSFTVVVDDDTPVAANDTNSLSEDAASVDGNVLNNDVAGADGGKTVTTPGSYEGTYGTLQLNANGGYTYTLKTDAVTQAAIQALSPGQQLGDSFGYTMKDGDGDTDTATLTITINGASDAPVVTVGGSDCTPEDVALSPTFTAAPVDALSAVTEIKISGLTNWTVPTNTISLTSGTVGTVAFAGGVLTIQVVGAAAGTAVTATVPMTPPANSDVDASILVNATSTYNGVGTTSADVAATLYVDAVADAPTAVDITVADSGDSGSSFSNGEPGTVQVHAVFSDLDGSETHTLTVQLAPGFTAGLSAAGNFTQGNVTYAYTYNAATGVITVTAPSNVATVDFNIPVTAPASGTLPSNLNFDLTVKATETALSGGGCAPGHTDDPANNVATVTDMTGIPATRVLNGSMVTNTNSSAQTMILTFVDSSVPLDSYSQVVLRGGQGQQGAVLSDAGFSIDASHSFYVAAEDTANSPSKVIITNFNLEGVTITPPKGNIQLDYDTSGGTNMGITAVINPTGPASVGGTYSTDGTTNANTITDTNTGLHYTFGNDDNDTLDGGAGPDVLNGGRGADTVQGGAGNDILVYDRLDLQLDGGAGWDILRIDDGALFNTTAQGGPASGFANAVVDLTGEPIVNIEEILITEEAIPLDNVGTTLKFTAQDVVDFTGDTGNDLYVVGSSGDKVDLSADTAVWTDTGTTTTSPGGQVFNLYTAQVNGAVANLYVDHDVTVVGIP